MEIVVYGGGVIGCEYAFIFAKTGTKVTLIDPRGTRLGFVDRQISDIIATIMKEDWIVLRLGENYKKKDG